MTTKTVTLGGKGITKQIKIGGGNPVSVQTMWKEGITDLASDNANKHVIQKAIEANLQIGKIDEELIRDIKTPETYTVEDVDFSLLTELFKRTDYIGTYGETIVFND